MSDQIGIRTFGLTKYYGAQRGIENLDLEVYQGEIFGFLGPNGAGKTTTIRLLLALAHIMILPVVLAVSGYSTLASCLFLDPRRSLAVAGIITAAMYLLNIMAPSLGSLRWLENLSLFHHIDLLSVLLGGAINWTGLAVHIMAAAATFTAALVIFERRDLSH